MEESLNNDQGDDVGTGSSRPTNRPDSRVWHGINQTSAIFGFPPAVARDMGLAMRGHCIAGWRPNLRCEKKDEHLFKAVFSMSGRRIFSCKLATCIFYVKTTSKTFHCM